MVVKGNHPSLAAVLPAFFEPPLGRPACQRQAQSLEKGHGRIEWRRLTTTTVGVSALALMSNGGRLEAMEIPRVLLAANDQQQQVRTAETNHWAR